MASPQNLVKITSEDNQAVSDVYNSGNSHQDGVDAIAQYCKDMFFSNVTDAFGDGISKENPLVKKQFDYIDGFVDRQCNAEHPGPEVGSLLSVYFANGNFMDDVREASESNILGKTYQLGQEVIALEDSINGLHKDHSEFVATKESTIDNLEKDLSNYQTVVAGFGAVSVGLAAVVLYQGFKKKLFGK